MTSPRFEPRAYCAVPEHFGRYNTGWRVPASNNSEAMDQLGAAKIQHQVAWLMRRAITGGKHRTIDTYSRSIGADPSRIGRMLRGTIVMRVEDMVSAQRNLGISIWAASPSNSEEADISRQVDLVVDPTNRSE